MQSSPETKGPAQRVAVSPAQPDTAPDSVTFYHWLVVIFASAGWLFDCMGQRIFVLSREPALRELLGATASDGEVKYWGGIATLLMMVGWATGGIIFGQKGQWKSSAQPVPHLCRQPHFAQTEAAHRHPFDTSRQRF